eukprot:GHVQ01013612.1.p1 GENE.GHVQ01013612.1~~GHVQ01013612.1.p1  ORF type:complete len:751 (-),score=81.28 GHVQ01013612.1:452-2704(-)
MCRYSCDQVHVCCAFLLWNSTYAIQVSLQVVVVESDSHLCTIPTLLGETLSRTMTSLETRSSMAEFLRVSNEAVHPDLVKARKQCTFSVAEMALCLYGSRKINIYSKLRKLLAHNAEYNAKELWWMSGKQRYLRACRQAEEFVQVVRRYRMMDDPDYMDAMLVMTGEDFFIHVHLAMFVPTIQNMSDEEQKREWLPAATNFTILGTYAQTELGHGSNVAGLETIADFDQKTDEWILSTPTLTATKWWAGGLGKSCTHCVLMSRLRIREKDYGVHPFILQIRDMDTHQSLKGVVLNHLGQKLGYNGMDNGTMQLHNVRIPRRNLLMRFCSVDRDGNYLRKGDQKLLYATMTFTRKQIIMNAGPQLAKNCTIATRYSAVRKQFIDPNVDVPKENVYQAPEANVLDYITQQRTLFPLIATTIAYWLTSQSTNDKYDSIMEECNKSDFSRLGDIHAMTSALKALMTSVVSGGIEQCRLACGGHGYALSAGIPLHLTNYAPQATYEGDFVVLSIQAGRILLKAVESKMKGECPERLQELSTKYIFDFDPFSENSPPDNVELCNSVWQLQAYKSRSCYLTYKAAQNFAAAKAEGKKTLQALEDVKLDLCKVTRAYGHLLVLQHFDEGLDRMKASEQVKQVLVTLRNLYALHWMELDFTEFVISNCTRVEHYEELQKTIKTLLKEFRPNAVGLTDAFGFPDYLLNSALGKYDGRVYEALYKATHYEPLNQHDVAEGYYKHLQYIIHPERRLPENSKL